MWSEFVYMCCVFVEGVPPRVRSTHLGPVDTHAQRLTGYVIQSGYKLNDAYEYTMDFEGDDWIRFLRFPRLRPFKKRLLWRRICFFFEGEAKA